MNPAKERRHASSSGLSPEGRHKLCYYLFKHTHMGKKAPGRETIIICNQAQKTRKGNLSHWAQIEIDGNK